MYKIVCKKREISEKNNLIFLKTQEESCPKKYFPEITNCVIDNYDIDRRKKNILKNGLPVYIIDKFTYK